MMTEVIEKDRTLTVEARCTCCGAIVPLKVRPIDWQLFNSPNRPFVQDCFPYLTNDEREMFISGTCAVCWDKMFSFDEDEDEEE